MILLYQVSKRLQTELEDIKGKFQAADSTQDKPVVSKKKAPMLAVIGKSSSGEVIVPTIVFTFTNVADTDLHRLST